MTDNEIKEDCLQEAGIDLGRYSHKELTQIKDALRRYHNAKLKLISTEDVIGIKNSACPKCHDKGWLYDYLGNRAGVCPCHYP